MSVPSRSCNAAQLRATDLQLIKNLSPLSICPWARHLNQQRGSMEGAEDAQLEESQEAKLIGC